MEVHLQKELLILFSSNYQIFKRFKFYKSFSIRYKNRGKIKKELSGITDGTQFFMGLRKIWMRWAMRFAKEWSYLHSTDLAKKDFGRSLAVMLKKDDLIIKNQGNKLTDLK